MADHCDMIVAGCYIAVRCGIDGLLLAALVSTAKVKGRVLSSHPSNPCCFQTLTGSSIFERANRSVKNEDCH